MRLFISFWLGATSYGILLHACNNMCIHVLSAEPLIPKRQNLDSPWFQSPKLPNNSRHMPVPICGIRKWEIGKKIAMEQSEKYSIKINFDMTRNPLIFWRASLLERCYFVKFKIEDISPGVVVMPSVTFWLFPNTMQQICSYKKSTYLHTQSKESNDLLNVICFPLVARS